MNKYSQRNPGAFLSVHRFDDSNNSNMIPAAISFDRKGSSTSLQSQQTKTRSSKRRKDEAEKIKQEITEEEILEKAQESNPRRVFDIDLHASDLQRVPALEKFTHVRVLDLSCNRIKHIDGLETCSELKELKLYGNEIEDLYPIEQISGLVILQLQYNRIASIGRSFSSLRKLHTLRLDSNRLQCIDLREIAACGALSFLDLSSNALHNSNFVTALPSIEELNLSNNKLTEIADLSRCKKLRDLDVSNNNITELSGLSRVKSLQSLRVSDNQLCSLSSLKTLNSLSELDVRNNDLRSVRGISSQLPGLEILDVSENHLDDWEVARDELSECTRLAELQISPNPCFTDDEMTLVKLTHQLLEALPGLEYIDKSQVRFKSRGAGDGAPVMRPLSARSTVSTRQVESQLDNMINDLDTFEDDVLKRFESLKSRLEELPERSALQPDSQRSRLDYSSSEDELRHIRNTNRHDRSSKVSRTPVSERDPASSRHPTQNVPRPPQHSAPRPRRHGAARTASGTSLTQRVPPTLRRKSMSREELNTRRTSASSIDRSRDSSACGTQRPRPSGTRTENLRRQGARGDHERRQEARGDSEGRQGARGDSEGRQGARGDSEGRQGARGDNESEADSSTASARSRRPNSGRSRLDAAKRYSQKHFN